MHVLRWISHRIRWALPAGLVLAACSDPSSATDLHPEGPPRIEQVRLSEVYSAGGIDGLVRTVFAFGTHADATDADEHAVTTASPMNNRLRIIMDELLRGNNLEEIQCRAVIGADAFSRVPVGATPDDIARCAVAKDVLPVRCPGSNPLSVCICQIDGGCLSADGTFTTPKGESVGVTDLDMDGAADVHRFIQGSVGLTCGGMAMPIDLVDSYWQPSGDQQVPAQGGFDALGPAVVLVPMGVLPTSTDCGLVFSPEVVDKDGNQVCAPPNGDINAGCMPGDTSAFKFTVAPLTLLAQVADPGQSRTGPVEIFANVPLPPGPVAGVTVTEGAATNYTDFTATSVATPSASEIKIQSTAAMGFAPATHYTITIPVTLTDTYQKPLPQPFTVAFTTGN